MKTFPEYVIGLLTKCLFVFLRFLVEVQRATAMLYCLVRSSNLVTYKFSSGRNNTTCTTVYVVCGTFYKVPLWPGVDLIPWGGSLLIV